MYAGIFGGGGALLLLAVGAIIYCRRRSNLNAMARFAVLDNDDDDSDEHADAAIQLCPVDASRPDAAEYCSSCGSAMKAKAHFCKACGAAQ
jgi:hypothetical protein